MDRAYSLLTLKSVDDGKRILTGTASTPTPDRMGDIVDPKGAEFKLPIPFLWQHDSKQPIGHVTKAKVTKDGIEVEVHLVRIDEPGTLKDRLDEAWQSIKAGLVRGMSIGFSPTEYSRIDTGLHFIKWLWLELSAVTIAANSEASIQTIKSIDSAQLAATGQSRAAPGASGSKAASRGNSTNRSPKGNQMKTLQELREDRNTKAARLQELVDLFKTDDHETSPEEEEEFDTLETDVKRLDLDIKVARFHAMNAATAKAVDGSSSDNGSRSRGGVGFVRKTDPEDSFLGQSFARIVKAKAVAFNLGDSHVAIAERMYGKRFPNLVRHIKAAVPGGGTGSGEWGSELVGIDNRYEGDFVKYLHGRTGFDQLGLREAPRNVSVKGMDGAAVGYWVGESKAIPASAPSASATDLRSLKIGGKAVMSNELMADSSPGAEMMVRDSLGDAIALRLDQTFFSATAASAGVSPAGILNGLTQIAMGGADSAALRAFINAAAAGFISGKTASGLILVMSPGTALALGMLVNALGQSEFPGLTESGGSLLGRRVVVSDNIDASQIILLNPREIWRIGDDGVEFAISREAMVEQDSAPTGASDTPVASSATLVSMFDTDSVAIRAVRRVSWALRRPAAAVVAYTDTADFGGTAS